MSPVKKKYIQMFGFVYINTSVPANVSMYFEDFKSRSTQTEPTAIRQNIYVECYLSTETHFTLSSERATNPYTVAYRTVVLNTRYCSVFNNSEVDRVHESAPYPALVVCSVVHNNFRPYVNVIPVFEEYTVLPVLSPPILDILRVPVHSTSRIDLKALKKLPVETAVVSTCKWYGF